MSHKNKSKSDLSKFKTDITNQIHKKEHDYNHQNHVSVTELNALYNDNVIMYTSLNQNEFSIHQDKNKTVELEKKFISNKDKNHTIKISKPLFYNISDSCLSVQYIIHYYDVLSPELYDILQKVVIKDVNMDELIDDLNQNGISVTQLLIEFNKNGKNLDSLMKYIEKNKISLSNVMMILYRHNVTIGNLLQNPFVNEIIKQSPTYSTFFGENNNTQNTKSTIAGKVSNRYLLSKIHVYVIYKINQDELSIVNINWNKLVLK